MKEKKVAIATLHRERNYGSFFQAYALKKFLDGSGCHAEVLRIYPAQDSSAGSRLRRALAEGGVKLAVSRFVKKIQSKYFYDRNVRLRNTILGAAADNIAGSEIYGSSGDYARANELYDIFIAGSDQIWGDSGRDLDSVYMYYLKGVTKPKISYAPSIGGGANFDRELTGHIVPLLNEFKHLSVRESEGVKFLREILDGKPVYHAIDPTLLIPAEEWEDGLKKENESFKYKNEKYIFVYLLGSSSEHRRFTKNFARAKNLKIISFPYLQSRSKADARFADINVYDASPNQCLLYIKNAEYVFTDSFHCTVFSGLFHKEFYVFKKQNHGSSVFENQFARLEDLLDLFASRSRYIPRFDINPAELDKIATDWSLLDTKLSVRREECREWLKSALESARNLKPG